MQTTATFPHDRNHTREERRHYHVERQFSSGRRVKDLVRDLLRAHCGE